MRLTSILTVVAWIRLWCFKIYIYCYYYRGIIGWILSEAFDCLIERFVAVVLTNVCLNSNFINSFFCPVAKNFSFLMKYHSLWVFFCSWQGYLDLWWFFLVQFDFIWGGKELRWIVIYAKESLLFEREASNAKTFLFIFLNEAVMLEWLVVVLRRLKYWAPAKDTDPLVSMFLFTCVLVWSTGYVWCRCSASARVGFKMSARKTSCHSKASEINKRCAYV